MPIAISGGAFGLPTLSSLPTIRMEGFDFTVSKQNTTALLSAQQQRDKA